MDAGGYELTDMDVLKLQKAYGCDGSCGGWAKSETGGFSHCLNFTKYCELPGLTNLLDGERAAMLISNHIFEFVVSRYKYC